MRRPISALKFALYSSVCGQRRRLDLGGDRARRAAALLGTAFLAYVLGLRHAVDADHIAAIDNVVRKLMQEGKQPVSVGLFFSLGHSLAIAIAVAAIAATAFALRAALSSSNRSAASSAPAPQHFSCWRSPPSISSSCAAFGEAFARAPRRAGRRRRSRPSAGRPRLLRPNFPPAVSDGARSWQMFPVGFLFGLGFDTATEISLFTVAATQASGGMTFATIMIFPALFTAGMTLVDTTDSVLMVGAYGWAFLNPIRKIWYNLTITAVSVVVALIIGGIEALGLIAESWVSKAAFGTWSATSIKASPISAMSSSGSSSRAGRSRISSIAGSVRSAFGRARSGGAMTAPPPPELNAPSLGRRSHDLCVRHLQAARRA